MGTNPEKYSVISGQYRFVFGLDERSSSSPADGDTFPLQTSIAYERTDHPAVRES